MTALELAQVLTFTEAADTWGLYDGSVIRKAVERNRFKPDEVKKSGKVWLTTYEAMSRVFGIPKEATVIFSYSHYIHLLKKAEENSDLTLLEDIEKQLLTTLEYGNQVAFSEKLLKKEQLLYIFKTAEEYLSWKKLMILKNQRNNDSIL